MSYIDRTLGNHETVLYRAHIHSLFFARIWALFFALTASEGWLYFAGYIGTPIALVLFAISTVFCLSLIIPLWTLEFALTNLRIVLKRGFITRYTHELELTTVEEVNIRQGFLGRILNYGTVDVRGIGDARDLVFKHISSPLDFRREIASAVQRLTERRGEVSASDRLEDAKIGRS